MYGWEPCETGCNHGCCEATTQICKCDGGYEGSFCEYTNGMLLGGGGIVVVSGKSEEGG